MVVQENVVEKIVYRQWCTENVVKEKVAQKILYREMVYRRCCTGNIVQGNGCTGKIAQGNVVQHMLYIKSCTGQC